MKLEILRRQIDETDTKIIKLIGKRLLIVQKIKEYKHRFNIPVENKERERLILNKGNELAKKIGINEGLISKIMILIIKESKKIQKI